MNGRDKRRERARRANVDWPWVPDYLPDYRGRTLVDFMQSARVRNTTPYPFSWRGRGG